MADIQTTYTLACPGGTITFNSGNLFKTPYTDLYWISVIHGLDGPAIRAPVDDVPYGDGGLVHKFWKGPRRVAIEGWLIAQTAFGNASLCQRVFNTMEAAVNTALNSILQANGTLSWTPEGQAAKSLTVRYEIPFDSQPDQGNRLRSFSFCLVSSAADPS